MTNQQIIRLLRDLQWQRWSLTAGEYKTCRGCGETKLMGHRGNVKHKKNCKIIRAIRALKK